MNEILAAIVGAFLAAIFSVIGVVLWWGFNQIVSLKLEVKELQTINKLEGQISAKILHSDDTPERDILIEACLNPNKEATPEQKKEFLSNLKDLLDDSDGDKAQRLLAAKIIANHSTLSQ